MKLALIRHGQTDWNVRGLLQGHSDIPLNEVGEDQARRAAEHYQFLQISKLFSSDLQRARQTAEGLGLAWGLAVEGLPEFREVHLGQAEGMNRDDMASRFGAEFVKCWSSTNPRDFHHRFPEGESKMEAAQRFLFTIKSWETSLVNSDASVGIVSHGLILKTLVSLFQDTSRNPFWIQNLSCLECNWDGHQLQLLRLHHLQDLEKKP
jgi:broad specificity phosphatase PhoE